MILSAASEAATSIPPEALVCWRIWFTMVSVPP